MSRCGLSFPTKSGIASRGRAEGFLATVCAFFCAEIGDKTQLATVGLAARFEHFYPVVIGTTLGMMLANVPAVLIGHRAAEWLPIRAIRVTAAIAFAALGVATLPAEEPAEPCVFEKAAARLPQGEVLS